MQLSNVKVKMWYLFSSGNLDLMGDALRLALITVLNMLLIG